MANKGAQAALGATEKGSKPGDYDLGSPQSRAAARAMIAEQISKRDTLTIVMSSFLPDLKITEPDITAWREGADGQLYRKAYLSPGMTLEEAERIVAEHGWKPPVRTVRRQPRPLVPEW